MHSTSPALQLTPPRNLRAASLGWRELAYGAALILAAAGFFTCWCDTPMIWDGSYQFCFSLIQQKPYFYLTRFHSYLLWAPMVLLSHLTGNLTVLKMAYGLPFTLAPAASVVLSWWVVRRRAPHLILWAIFGAAAAPLPGQIFIINDSIFQQHMFWPVFLGLLVPLEMPQIFLLLLLVVFQFSHQIGLVLLTGGAGAAALLAIRDKQNRTELLIKGGVALGLAAVALWKIFHFPDSYARQEFTWTRAHEAWQYGVEGYPLRGVSLMWSAGICLLLPRVLPADRWARHRKTLRALAVGCVAAAGVLWIIWACDARLWSDALNYRRWVVPLTVPFYFMAFFDAWTTVGSSEILDQPGQSRADAPRLIGYAVACIFAAVLSVQSAVWLAMTRHLMRDVERRSAVLVPWTDVQWATGTALDHWGTSSFVYVLEGRTPRHILLDRLAAEQQLAILRLPGPKIPLAPFTPIRPTPGPSGWFDFRPLLKRLTDTARYAD